MMKVYTLSIFLLALLGLTSAWLNCPAGQKYQQFNRVVYDPNPRTESWEECVPENSLNNPNVGIDGEQHGQVHFPGSTSIQGLQCPAGTIKKTYQRPVNHPSEVPQTYEQCDPEGPMNTNQNPPVSPTGQNWNEYYNPTGTSNTQGLQCPPGTIRRTYQRPVSHYTEIPQTYEQCDPEGPINTNQKPAVSPTGQNWNEYNNPTGTSNTQGLQCPAGTIKRTYQRPVSHYTEVPQTYEQCDPEGPINTNQNPAVSPTGQNWNEWNRQPSGSVSSEPHGAPCPEGYIKVQVQEPTSHPGETPQVVVKCHPQYNDKNGPMRAPNGETWGVYNG